RQHAPGAGRVAGAHGQQTGADEQRVLVGRIAEVARELGQQIGGEGEVGRGAALLKEAGLGVQAGEIAGASDEGGVEAREGLAGGQDRGGGARAGSADRRSGGGRSRRRAGHGGGPWRAGGGDRGGKRRGRR